MFGKIITRGWNSGLKCLSTGSLSLPPFPFPFLASFSPNGEAKNLLNEVPLERSILADFAFFYRRSLNEKLNGSMKESVYGSN